MAKVVFRKTEERNSGLRSDDVSVDTKKIRDPSGATRILRTIDTNSASLGADLTYVFEKNVAKARRENKRVTGRADFELPRK